MNDLAILIPTFNRPENLPRLIENIGETTKLDHCIYFVIEAEDTATAKALLEAKHQSLLVGSFGSYAKAINWAYRHTTEPLLFAGADDLLFHANWLDPALELLQGYTEVVGTNDLGNASVLSEDHATHYLTTRHYLDTQGGLFDEGPGSFLYEGYDHNYTDTEFIETAKDRGVFAPCLDAVVEHMHPSWAKAEMDTTYDKSFRDEPADRNRYLERKAARVAAA